MLTKTLVLRLVVASVSVFTLLAAEVKTPPATATTTPNYSRAVYSETGGKLVYVPDAKGNVIPDCSHCGYGGGGVPLPSVPARQTLSPEPGTRDDLFGVQAAIDVVDEIALDTSWFRGGVLLQQGEYRISGTLRMPAGVFTQINSVSFADSVQRE